MRRKGFTLIELLAVIVVLAIIALIAVPVIMNIIAKSNKSAFKDSAYGIIKAGELYYSDKLLEPNGMENDIAFEFSSNIEGLDIKGSMPSSGSMKVTKEGKVAIAVSNGRYCAKKGFDETEVTVDENIDTCELPKKSNPNITSSEVCATKDGEVCPNGTKVNVKVNDSENYDFYVIKDTGTELTLIMNKNIGSRIAWISKEDYLLANTDGTVCGYESCNDEGPLTALKALEDRTAGWTNIEAKNYTLVDDGGGNKYQPIQRVNTRARMLTKTETNSLGCTESYKICPSFLYENLSADNSEIVPVGYWTSSAYSGLSNDAWGVVHSGNMSYGNLYTADCPGVRPVIEISKTI